MARSHEIVIIGGGHNGLTVAGYRHRTCYRVSGMSGGKTTATTEKNSYNGFICLSWMNWDMSLFPKQEQNCFSR